MKGRFLKSLLILSICLAGVISSAYAQYEEEEEFWSALFGETAWISSVNLFETQTKKAPGYATVIDLDSNSYSSRSVKDYMDSFAPSIVIGNLEESGPILSTRGIMVDSNAKTLFMLDGMHLNHRNHFGYANEMGSVLTGDIKSLEIINGPGAIANGSGAISGFVNIVPRNGSDDEGLKIISEYGVIENLKKLEMTYGIKFDEDKDLLIYAGYAESEGKDVSSEPWDIYNLGNSLQSNDRNGNQWPLPDILMYHNNEGEISAREIDDSYKVAAYWNHGDFKLNTFYRRDMNINAGYVYGYRHSNNGINERIGQNTWYTGSLGINPQYTMNISETEAVDFKGTFLLLDQGRIYDDSILGSNIEKMDSETHKELKTVLKTTRFENNQLALGFSYGMKDFKIDDSHFMDDGYGGTGEAAETDWKELSFFAEDVIAINDKWTASLGLRYDELQLAEVKSQNNYKLEDADNTSIRIATAYKISPTLNAKLSYQQGFRFIDTAYLNWFIHFNNALSGLGYANLPDFKPEKMDSYEFNLSKDFPDWNLKIDLNVYLNSFEDMLGWFSYSTAVPGALSSDAVAAVIDQEGWMGSHTNILGEFKTIGADLIVKFVPTENSLLTFIYGYSEPYSVSSAAASSTSLFTNDKDEFTRYPQHLVKVNYAHSFLEDKLHTSVSAIYQSAIDYKEANFNLGSVYDDPRIKVNASVEYQLNDACSLKLSGENILENEVPTYAFQTPYGGNVGEELAYWYLSLKYKM